MRPVLFACLWIVACACGASESSSGGSGSSSGGESGDVSAAPTCVAGELRRTETQVCHCGTITYCGGAAPSPETLERLSRQVSWQCRPVASAACEAVFGGDVTEGSPCEEEGEVCDVGGCCGGTVRCIDGAWRNEPGPCPA